MRHRFPFVWMFDEAMRELVASPQHRYTRHLYAAVPKLTLGTARGEE